MNTTVINIKSLPHGWQTLREYQDFVYIGRATPGLLPTCTFGNPYRPGDAVPEQGIQRATMEDCVHLYELHLPEHLRDVQFRLQVRALSGKTLVCWCAPYESQYGPVAGMPCHGVILARVADELHAEAKALLPPHLRRTV